MSPTQLARSRTALTSAVTPPDAAPPATASPADQMAWMLARSPTRLTPNDDDLALFRSRSLLVIDWDWDPADREAR